MRMRCAALLLLGALVFGVPAHALQITLSPVSFNTMYEDNPTRASGQSTSLFFGPIASGSQRRILLKFDPSSLPANATVTSATLRLDINRAAIGSDPGDTIRVHRVLASWGQGTAMGPGGGGGTQASAGDATWNARFYNSPPSTPSLLWTSPGGDFVATPSYSAGMGLASGTLDVSSTTGMVADIQAWRTNPSANHGWVILGPEGSEFSQKARRVVGVTLTVDYDPPSAAVPSLGPIALLIALGVIGGIAYALQTRTQLS